MYMWLLQSHSPPLLSAHFPYSIHVTLSNLALCLPSSSPNLQSEGNRLDQRNAGKLPGVERQTVLQGLSGLLAQWCPQCRRCCVLAECGCCVGWEQWHHNLVLLDPQISCLWGLSFRGKFQGILLRCQNKPPWLGGCAESIEHVPPYHRPGYRRTHSFVCVISGPAFVLSTGT